MKAKSLIERYENRIESLKLQLKNSVFAIDKAKLVAEINTLNSVVRDLKCL